MAGAAKRKPKTYVPRDDWGIRSVLLPKDDVPKRLSQDWVQAPGGSHLRAFRLRDGREHSEQVPLHTLSVRRKARATDWPFPATGPGEFPSVIDVRFRATKSHGETWYAYSFADHDEAARLFDLLSNAEHPGEIIHSEFAGGQITYKRVA